MPILGVVNPRSAIIPPESILPALRAMPSRDKRVLRYDGATGVALQHVGVLVGRNAHRHLWPAVLRWLRGLAGDCRNATRDSPTPPWLPPAFHGQGQVGFPQYRKN